MRLKWCHLVPARYSLMYLAATSVRGLRFQGNGHPKKDAKSNYRAALVSPFPAVSGRVSLMLQRRGAFHGGKAQTAIRLF